jgi:hypothetical protein
MYTGNVIGVLIVLLFVPCFAAILRLPFAILIPLIVYVCAIGAYAVHNSMLDIWYMLIFGVVGYFFKKLDYPIAPMVLALVLGDAAESALRQCPRDRRSSSSPALFRPGWSSSLPVCSCRQFSSLCCANGGGEAAVKRLSRCTPCVLTVCPAFSTMRHTTPWSR